jgi:hypothetical protein
MMMAFDIPEPKLLALVTVAPTFQNDPAPANKFLTIVSPSNHDNSLVVNQVYLDYLKFSLKLMTLTFLILSKLVAKSLRLI